MRGPKVGYRFLTVTGAPVQVLEAREDAVMLQGLASDNRFSVPADYPLEPLRGTAIFELKSEPYVPRTVRLRQAQTPQVAKPLAPIIDAVLLAGGKTMRGIVRELKRKASTACHGRDLRANIRARIYWLKKRGLNVSIKPGDFGYFS